MKAKLLRVIQLGNPILRQKAFDVKISWIATQQLAADLLHTCKVTKGVGIAATQVGKLLRIIVVASEPNERYPNAPKMEPTVMINPIIIARSVKQVTGYEGCLSIPGIRALIPRNKSITVRWLDQDHNQHKKTFSGFIARIIQHEIDHLDGIVFLDRASSYNIVTDQEYLRIMKEKNAKRKK
jgi:peptide deformylase